MPTRCIINSKCKLTAEGIGFFVKQIRAWCSKVSSSWTPLCHQFWLLWPVSHVIKATCEGIRCIVSNWIIEIYVDSTIPNWLQVVQAKALQATQLVEFVWSMKLWHMCSRTGMFEQEKLCSCIGEGKLCAGKKCIWLLSWWIILSLINSRDPVCIWRLQYWNKL